MLLLLPPRKAGSELITDAGNRSTTGSIGACDSSPSSISNMFTKVESGVGSDWDCCFFVLGLGSVFKYMECWGTNLVHSEVNGFNKLCTVLVCFQSLVLFYAFPKFEGGVGNVWDQWSFCAWAESVFNYIESWGFCSFMKARYCILLANLAWNWSPTWYMLGIGVTRFVLCWFDCNPLRVEWEVAEYYWALYHWQPSNPANDMLLLCLHIIGSLSTGIVKIDWEK